MSWSEDEEGLAIARDIAEFEKNKHLCKPSKTLDKIKVSSLIFLNKIIDDFLQDRDVGWRVDKELGLSRNPMSSIGLTIVGQGMSRHEVIPPIDAPSQTFSQTSRAESIGSLADLSQHGGYYGSNVVPADNGTEDTYYHQAQVGLWIC